MRSFSSKGAFSSAMKETLRDLLAKRALQVAKRGEFFTLSTGRKSNFYFNCKPVTFSSDGAPLVVDAFLDKLRQIPESVTAVGGRTLGADPIVVGMMLGAPSHGLKLEAFLVRDKQKAHGTKELIANCPSAGSNVVIVDDVVTTGQSTIDAIDAAQAAGCNVVGVIVLMDRREQNGEANIRARVPNYFAVYTRDDFPQIGETERWDTKTSEPQSDRADSTFITSGT